MSDKKHNSLIAFGLLVVVIMWGGNNAGTKWLVGSWPPVWTGSVRFIFAGAILLGVLRFTSWLGQFEKLTPELWRELWGRGGLSLAIYTGFFCWALHLAPAAHAALYLGASPIWALLWEGWPQRNWSSLRRYAAAVLAVTGVLVLFWPALRAGADHHLLGEFFGLAASISWANYSRQSRLLSNRINGLEVAANSMWMAGAILFPVGLWEVSRQGLIVDVKHFGVQGLCIFFGGVIPYAIWNSALRHWRTSQVMLFNNFIPLTTAAWVYFLLGEPLTSTFYAAMILIVSGVILGQVDVAKIFNLPESF